MRESVFFPTMQASMKGAGVKGTGFSPYIMPLKKSPGFSRRGTVFDFAPGTRKKARQPAGLFNALQTSTCA